MVRNLVFTLSIISFNIIYSQKYFNEKDLDSYIDYTTKSINLTIDGNKVEGVFTKMKGKDYYEYLVVKGNNNIHLVMKILTNDRFYGYDVIKGDYNLFLKEFKKGRKYKKTEVLYSNLPSQKIDYELNFISESTVKRKMEQKLAEESFLNDFKQSDIEGVYKIKIFKHRNLDYKNVDTFGKIIITDVGVTIQTEIPSLNLIRGSHNKSSSKPLEGSFICNINKGYGDFFSLKINEDKTVGGLTVMNGRNATTTTFMIID